MDTVNAMKYSFNNLIFISLITFILFIFSEFNSYEANEIRSNLV